MVMRIKWVGIGKIKLVINCHVFTSCNKFLYRMCFPPLEPFKTPRKPFAKPIGKPIRKPSSEPFG